MLHRSSKQQRIVNDISQTVGMCDRDKKAWSGGQQWELHWSCDEITWMEM